MNVCKRYCSNLVRIARKKKQNNKSDVMETQPCEYYMCLYVMLCYVYTLRIKELIILNKYRNGTALSSACMFSLKVNAVNLFFFFFFA